MTNRILREAEPGYVLHSYSFKETSLVVEVFTRDCGRLGLVAKGARRPRSSLRGTLMAFQPLLLSWSGRSELRVLHRAEWQAGQPQLSGLALICGFYLNELVLKLMPRDDPHEGLYAGYEEALAALRAGDTPAAVLRRFEHRMLTELGYALLLTEDVHGAAIDAAAATLTRGARSGSCGRLAAMPATLCRSPARRCWTWPETTTPPVTVQQSRALMRRVINHYLGGQALHTRQLLRDMQFQVRGTRATRMR